MSIEALISVAGLLVALVGFVWLTVVVARRLILREALDEVGVDDRVLLEREVRRRLGPAATPHEVERVLKPVNRVRTAARP